MNFRAIVRAMAVVGLGLVLLASTADAQSKTSSTQKQTVEALLGTWSARGEEGETRLIFETEDRLVFDGEPLEYRLVPGAIHVQDEFGETDYKYTLKGDLLKIDFPEGYTLEFRRLKTAAKPSSKGGTAGAGERMLFGTLCNYSGSSGSYGGYSITRAITFDGHGNFTTGSESAYSTKHYDSGGDQTAAGHGYGSGEGSSGTYHVNGETILFTFSDGSTAEGRVHFRQDNGTITEIMVNDRLYGKALCE
jgi:hypothetical protein